jgi:hypothetical protein
MRAGNPFLKVPTHRLLIFSQRFRNRIGGVLCESVMWKYVDTFFDFLFLSRFILLTLLNSFFDFKVERLSCAILVRLRWHFSRMFNP